MPKSYNNWTNQSTRQPKWRPQLKLLEGGYESHKTVWNTLVNENEILIDINYYV